MTQQYLTPHRPKRPASRLVAGLLWLVAACLAVGSTFADIVIYQVAGGASLFVVGFWRQYGLSTDGQENSLGTIYYGASEVAGGALLLLATLLVLLSVRRWAAVVAGATGMGMLVASALTWFLTALSEQANTTLYIQSGLWMLTSAVGVAVLALLVSLLERGRAEQPRQPRYFAPPMTPPTPRVPAAPPSSPQAQPLAQPPPLSPRWEPETPKYGITEPETPPRPTPAAKPVPEAEPAAPVAKQASTAVAGKQDPSGPLDMFDSPEVSTSIAPPQPAPDAGSISHKLDGDDK